MPPFFQLFRRSGGWLTAITLLLLYADAAIAKKLDGDQLLDPNRLIEIKLELSPQDWAQLCRQARNPATAFSGLPSESPYTYFRADIWIDGVKIASVGLRKKGFFGSADTRRPSLKVKFDEYEKQDPIKGLSRLTLNNNKQDRAQVSQFLTYRMFRNAGNPAPRCNWAHVTVNGQSLGIYSNVESIKKPFLIRAFQDKTGNLYEGTLTDFHPNALANIEVKTNEDENDLSDIKRLAAVLAKEGDVDLDELGQILDLDSFYRHWALESLTGFWDGYSSNQNNYYLYFNPKNAGRGQFIPWGADWVFTNGGPFARGGIGNQGPTVIYAQGILTNRLYHTAGGPERYRATLRQILEDVWDEDAMLAEVDRVEKLVSPHLHEAQSGTPQALNELRGFIRGRREVMERALKNWRPNVPPEPRKPAYVVDVGKASGTFTTTFTGGGPDQAEKSESDVVIQLDGKPLEFEKVSVRAQLFQFPGSGGFGGPPGGGGPGPRGPGAAQAPPAPVSLLFTGERSEGQPITVSLTIDREEFGAGSDDAIRVTGSFREGRGGGFGFGGGGPGRSVLGKLRLTKSGTKAGDEVSGSIELRIVETHGGFFQQRRPAGGGGSQRPGGGGFQRPGSGNAPPAFGQPQPLSLQRALDTDRNGTISATEIEQAATALKRLDRNQDGKLTGEELQSSPGNAGPGNRPARQQRPPTEGNSDSEATNPSR